MAHRTIIFSIKKYKKSLSLANWLIFVELCYIYMNYVIYTWIGTRLCTWLSGLKAIIKILSKKPGGNLQKKKRDFDLQVFVVHLKYVLNYVLLIHQYLLQMFKWMVTAMRGHPGLVQLPRFSTWPLMFHWPLLNRSIAQRLLKRMKCELACFWIFKVVCWESSVFNWPEEFYCCGKFITPSHQDVNYTFS